MELLIKNANVFGQLEDILLKDGKIAQIGSRLKSENIFDANGSKVFPGLIDIHTHGCGGADVSFCGADVSGADVSACGAGVSGCGTAVSDAGCSVCGTGAAVSVCGAGVSGCGAVVSVCGAAGSGSGDSVCGTVVSGAEVSDACVCDGFVSGV